MPSAPVPPWTMSSPGPAEIWSGAAPASRLSLPSPPSSVSWPKPPSAVSLPGLADEAVVAGAAVEHVVPGAPGELVAARLAEDLVGTGVADHAIVAAAGADDVAARLLDREAVSPGGAGQGPRVGGRGEDEHEQDQGREEVGKSIPEGGHITGDRQIGLRPTPGPGPRSNTCRASGASTKVGCLDLARTRHRRRTAVPRRARAGSGERLGGRIDRRLRPLRHRQRLPDRPRQRRDGRRDRAAGGRQHP